MVPILLFVLVAVCNADDCVTKKSKACYYSPFFPPQLRNATGDTSASKLSGCLVNCIYDCMKEEEFDFLRGFGPKMCYRYGYGLEVAKCLMKHEKYITSCNRESVIDIAEIIEGRRDLDKNAIECSMHYMNVICVAERSKEVCDEDGRYLIMEAHLQKTRDIIKDKCINADEDLLRYLERQLMKKQKSMFDIDGMDIFS